MKKNTKEIQEELEELAPRFSKMEKEYVFKVPENYFDQLSDNILQELNLSEDNKVIGQEASKQPSWWSQVVEQMISLLQPIIAVGLASVAILVGSFFYFSNKTIDDPVVIAEISTEEASEYLLENIDEFEDELLFELAIENNDLNDNNFEESELDEYLNEIIDEIDDSELEEFL